MCMSVTYRRGVEVFCAPSGRMTVSKEDTVDIVDFYEDLTYYEVHIAVEGLFDGFRQVRPRFGKKVQGKVVADSWYYKFLYVFGYLLKYVILIVAGLGVT